MKAQNHLVNYICREIFNAPQETIAQNVQHLVKNRDLMGKSVLTGQHNGVKWQITPSLFDNGVKVEWIGKSSNSWEQQIFVFYSDGRVSDANGFKLFDAEGNVEKSEELPLGDPQPAADLLFKECKDITPGLTAISMAISQANTRQSAILQWVGGLALVGIIGFVGYKIFKSSLSTWQATA